VTHEATPDELAAWWQQRRAGGATLLPNGELDPGEPHPDHTAMPAALAAARQRERTAVRVAAILPCRGRAEQTVRNVRRLLATAGDVAWELWLVAGGEQEVFEAIAPLRSAQVHVLTYGGRMPYWKALGAATRESHAPLLVGLANDLLPGAQWLQRAVEAYDATFPDGDGLMGFNGDSWPAGHACHFLISRALLARYGGWPVWYDHNFGDTELCQRAQAERRYAKAPWALLFHDHPYFGGADDAVYAEGRAQSARDEALYHQRRAAGWPPISR
jgi:hypothetical protein